MRDAEDLRLRELAEQEPLARALGPFAVVDVLHGTSPKDAAERERTGYYAEVQRTAVDAPPPAPPSPPTPPPPPHRSAPPAVAAPAPAKAPKRKKPLTLAEQVAPRRREKGQAPTPPRPPPEEKAPGFRPKRELPLPRGRFTRVKAPLERAERLGDAASKAELVALAGQVEHRFALRKLLALGHTSKGSDTLAQADVDRALVKHGLEADLARRERELLLGGCMEHRGALSSLSKAIGVQRPELDALVAHLGLKREVREIRDRFTREALAARALSMRLGLLNRRRYLDDLGITRRFEQALRADLTAALESAADDSDTRAETLALAAKRQAVGEDVLLKAIETLGLTAILEAQPID
ncbi:MAG: hypothetical protein K1X89_27920 [Myxococcaceae bacterium]|nr:hypothetical protein [Myxococcaceae bacterium]